ncbi:MAG TPA: DUF459 domain-containing protein [Acidimicrobiales bacterium]|nr:DUF459 domain-containing protein [Acidimicrobiales bacterium]
MNTSANARGQQRWPLRLVLSFVLLLLLIAGWWLRPTAPRAHALAPSTTSAVATTTPTSVVAPRIAVVNQPLANTLALNEPAHGCGFAMAPSPTRVVGHCTVLEIGDSLGNDLGWGLSRELAATHSLGLVQEDLSSSGLVTQWFYNWPANLKKFLARYHPDLVVVCLGANDQQSLVVHGHATSFNEPAWRTRYQQLIRQIDTLVVRAHAYVLWVGLPIMAPITYREGTVVLNSLYRSVAQTQPGVTFLPTWSLLASPSGDFQNAASVNDARAVLRATDGIHLSRAGEDVMATYVTTEIAALYHVKVRPALPTHLTP